MQTRKINLIAFCIFGAIAPSAVAQWVTLPTGTTTKYESIYFFDAMNGVVSSWGKVLLSSNAGASWTVVNVNSIRDIDFASTTVGYSAGVSGQSLKKTTNGGTTWTPLTPINSNSLWGVSVVDANTVYVSGTGKVVWKSTNGGASFTAVNLPSGADLVVDLQFISATTGCALDQGGVWKTTNGGSSWVKTSNTTGVLFTSIYFVDAMTGFAVGSGGAIIKTTNGGLSWTSLTSGSTAYLLQYVHFFDQNHGITVGYGGVILRTTNGGATWFQENAGTTEDLFCCILLSPTVALAGGDNGLMMKNSNLTTATEETDEQVDNCKIFPNPTRDGLFSISSEQLIRNIKVFDAISRLVYESVGEKFETSVDLSDCPDGLYVVKAEIADAMRIFKIVKEK